MNELPPDVHLLQTEPSSPAEEFGLTWCRPRSLPAELIPSENRGPSRAAWAAMLRELSFFASMRDGNWLALWRHAETLPPEQAPIVMLDTEGQLSCVAAKLADWFVAEAAQPHLVRAWFLDRGVDAARDLADVFARNRWAPDPQARLERLREGQSSEAPPRDIEPKAPEDLLGMHGRDPRVQAFLARIERADRPLELRCDFAGRISTIWLKPERLAAPPAACGITVGGPAEQTATLGAPTRSGEGWSRWDQEDVALHIEYSEGRVRQVTLMHRPSLEQHLR